MCTFNLTQDQICSLRNQGFSDRDIATAAAIAKNACVSIDDVVASYCESKDWNSVATKYNLYLADLQAMVSQCLCPQPLGAGPCECYAIYTKTGNVLLTRDDALRYYAMGYDWMDVALATNVALQTGHPILVTLMDIRRGITYEDVARMQGVPFDVAFNFTNYPFPRRSIYSASVEAKNIEKFAKYQVATQPGYTPMMSLPALRPTY
jgi:hypothetical protein